MTEEYIAFFEMTMKDCSAIVKAYNDDIALASQYKPPETRTQKCLYGCFFEFAGAVCTVHFLSFVKLFIDTLNAVYF